MDSCSVSTVLDLPAWLHAQSRGTCRVGMVPPPGSRPAPRAGRKAPRGAAGKARAVEEAVLNLRGCIAAVDMEAGQAIIPAEASFCWQLDVGARTNVHTYTACERAPSLATGLLQMAPYCMTPADAQAAVADSCVRAGAGADTAASPAPPAPHTSEARAPQAGSTPYAARVGDLVAQVMQHNAFAMTLPFPSPLPPSTTPSDVAAAACTHAPSASRQSCTPPAASVRTGRAVFGAICFVNHSCLPNAKVQQVAPPASAPSTARIHSVLPSADAALDASPPASSASEALHASDVPGGDALLVHDAQAALDAAVGTPWYSLTARLPIRAGEEVCISYVPRAHTRAQRQAVLQQNFGFRCVCARCTRAGDDTLVARCAECDGTGRVYFGSDVCEDCGAPAPALPDNFEDDAAMMAGIMDTPLSPHELWERICEHPLLAREDRRLWTALAQLVQTLAATRESNADDAALFDTALAALVRATQRCAFVTLDDLDLAPK